MHIAITMAIKLEFSYKKLTVKMHMLAQCHKINECKHFKIKYLQDIDNISI